jgi:diadenosine tetraphosphate (Ap4A) HIT family hydrolase
VHTFIPKKHVERFSDLSTEEKNELFDEVSELEKLVIEKFAPGCDISQHYRPFIPNSKFKVSHLHIHIRPRFLDDELYMKVQKFENDIFEEPNPEEYDKFKTLFKK